MDNPMSSSFVLYGIVNGRQSKFLKNDDCNTNITSGDFVEKNKYNNIINKKLDIEHCNDNYLEQWAGTVMNAVLQMGNYQ